MRKLKVEDARLAVDSASIASQGTRETAACREIIGQDRALHALEVGLQVPGRGFNIYVAGPPGIGKMTSVRSYLERLARERPTPNDLCFVHNHKEPYEPRAILLSAGKGQEFRKDVQNLKSFIESDISGAFESDEYQEQQSEALKEIHQQGEGVQQEIKRAAEAKGFMLQQTLMGMALVPVKDGQPLQDKDLQQLPEEDRKEINRKRQELQQEIQEIQRKYRRLNRVAGEKIEELDRQIVRNRLEGPIDDVKEKYKDNAKVGEYLDSVMENVLENIDTLKQSGSQNEQNVPPQLQQQMEMVRQQFFSKYNVNVAVDNSGLEGAPVVQEINPNYNNLIGHIEKEMKMGAVSTDYSLIKAGALLRANGGFLVLSIEDVLRSLYSWDGLKRALRIQEVRIEEVQQQLGLMSIKTLRPEAVPLDVKVILVGRPIFYQLLHTYDEDFQELFRIKADFDIEMDANETNIRSFVGFLGTFAEQQKLMPLDKSGLAKVVEQAARMAGHKEKLSTEFGSISDLLREANFWAARNKATGITAAHVKQALDEKVYRSSLIKEKLNEYIKNGSILIDTADAEVAQVNGLSIVQLGDFSFGRPNRITATVTPGREGVTDIEREARLGGPIHNKGVMILSGFLSRTFGRNQLLTISARLVFEQSYQGVEGDSASSAELYALLSALADVPLAQGIAVTGSVNQHGQVQAVGGINQKIEGFYDVCNIKGAGSGQGVIIPEANVQNLMLREDVVEAIEKGTFAIWSVSAVAEAIEILTGEKAGEMQPDGTFPDGTLFRKVSDRLDNYHSGLKQWHSDITDVDR